MTNWDKLKTIKPKLNVDKAIRNTAFDAGMSEKVYLHQSLKPLDEVDLNENQIDMFNDECEGHCGI